MAVDGILTLQKKLLCQRFVCDLCHALLIDAVALPECAHEFCKSCIVNYITSRVRGPYLCPKIDCAKEIHKTKPFSMLKNDIKLQSLIYKLFPRVYQDEMAKRRLYYTQNPESMAFFDPMYGSRASTLEDLGTLQNLEWLPRDVPKSVTVMLTYCDILSECNQPSRELKEKGRMALAQISICYHLASDTLVGDLRDYIAHKFDLRSEEMVIILLTNIILQNTYTLADIIRYFCCKEANTLRFEYLLTDPTDFPDNLSRDAAIARLLHKKPLLVNPTTTNLPSLSEEPSTSTPTEMTPDSAESLAQMDICQTDLQPEPKPKRRRRKVKSKPFSLAAEPDETIRTLLKRKLRKKERLEEEEETVVSTVDPLVSLTTTPATDTILPTPEEDDARLLQRCRQISTNFSKGEHLLLSRLAGVPNEPTVIPSGTLPKAGDVFYLHNPTGWPSDCPLASDIDTTTTGSLGGAPVIQSQQLLDSSAKVVVKRRKRRDKQLGTPPTKRMRTLRKVLEDVAEADCLLSLYEQVGSDHTYAMDPRFEPVRKARRPARWPSSVAHTGHSLSRYVVPRGKNCTENGPMSTFSTVDGEAVTDEASPPVIRVPMPAQFLSGNQMSNKQFVMLTSAAMSQVQQTGPSRTYLVSSDGKVEPSSSTSVSIPNLVQRMSPNPEATPNKDIFSYMTSTKTSRFTSPAAVKSGVYARLAPRPTQEASIKTFSDSLGQLRSNADLIFGTNRRGNTQKQRTEIEIHAQVSDDGRALQIGLTKQTGELSGAREGSISPVAFNSSARDAAPGIPA